MKGLFIISKKHNFSKWIEDKIGNYLGITIFHFHNKSHTNFACESIEYPI